MNPDDFLGYIGRELETRFGLKKETDSLKGMNYKTYVCSEPANETWSLMKGHPVPATYGHLREMIPLFEEDSGNEGLTLYQHWGLYVFEKYGYGRATPPVDCEINCEMYRIVPLSLPAAARPSESIRVMSKDEKVYGIFTLQYDAGGHDRYKIGFRTDDFATIKRVKICIDNPKASNALPPDIKVNDPLEQTITRILDEDHLLHGSRHLKYRVIDGVTYSARHPWPKR